MAFLNLQILLLALITAIPAIWLCFYSHRNIHVSRISAAFLLGWLIVGALDRSMIVMLVAGIVTAIAAAVVIASNSELTPRLLPFLCGGLVGIKLVQLARYTGANHIVIILLLVILMAAAIMLLSVRFGERVEVLVAAAAGAGALLAGVSMLPLASWIAYPQDGLGSTLALAAWLALTITGAVFQFRRMSR